MSVMRRVRPVWAGVAAASVAVVVASVVGSVATGMGWYWVHNDWRDRFDYGVAVCSGGVHARFALNDNFYYTGTGGPDLAQVLNLPPSSNCWWFEASMGPGFVEPVVPLWAIGAVSGMLCVIALGRSSRCQRGHCPKCNYNLAGLSSGLCPECGTNVARNSSEVSA